jgi:hypothetical protein
MKPFQIGTIAIGLFLMIYYCVRMYRLLRGVGLSEAEREDNYLSLMGGWVGGIMFVSVGLIFTLSTRFLSYIIPGAILLMLCWFPIVNMIKRLIPRSEDELPTDERSQTSDPDSSRFHSGSTMGRSSRNR